MQADNLGGVGWHESVWEKLLGDDDAIETMCHISVDEARACVVKGYEDRAEQINAGVFPKRCFCCETLYARDEWLALKTPRNVEYTEGLRWRDCPCGNTMAVDVEEFEDIGRSA
jgi:hypothetical protein